MEADEADPAAVNPPPEVLNALRNAHQPAGDALRTRPLQQIREPAPILPVTLLEDHKDDGRAISLALAINNILMYFNIEVADV